MEVGGGIDAVEDYSFEVKAGGDDYVDGAEPPIKEQVQVRMSIHAASSGIEVALSVIANQPPLIPK